MGGSLALSFLFLVLPIPAIDTIQENLMKHFLAIPVMAVAVAACGGESNQGTAQAGDRTWSPILLADAGQYGTMVDAKAAPSGLPGNFAPVTMNGARGNDGLFWLRQYSVGHAFGAIRIQALPKPAQPQLTEAVPEEEVLVWKTWEMEVIEHQDATTYSAPTLDGRQAWLTLHRSGQVIGGGYHDLDKRPDSYLRLGNPEQDLGFAPVEEKQLTCWDYAPTGAPIEIRPEGYRITVSHDRSAYPWSSLRVQSADGGTADFDSDPSGSFWQPSYGGPLQLRLAGNEVRAWVGASGGPGGTEYRLVDGHVAAIQRNRHFVSSYCRADF